MDLEFLDCFGMKKKIRLVDKLKKYGTCIIQGPNVEKHPLRWREAKIKSDQVCQHFSVQNVRIFSSTKSFSIFWLTMAVYSIFEKLTTWLVMKSRALFVPCH